MAQAFVSTYLNHYRWNCQPRTPPFDPNKLTKIKPEGDIWLLTSNKDADEEPNNLSEIEEAIHQLYLRRMRSTYRIYHCDNLTQVSKSHKAVGENIKEEDDSSAEVENELQEYCKKLYESRDQKIIPPLDTARNVLGYMRPAKLLKPLTTYQNVHGRVGYEVLKKNKIHVHS